MKRVMFIIAAAVLLCAAVSPAAGGVRVMVIPFEDTTGELKGVEDDLTAAAIDEVKASGRYTYISPGQYAENWMKDVKEGEKKLFGADMVAELKDLKRLKPMFVHDELGSIAEHRERWGVDLVIVGQIRKEGEALKLYTEIIGMNTGRFYAASGECQPGLMKDEATRQMHMLMAKGDAVQEVGADRQLDPVMSVVVYEIKTASGEDLLLVADYTARRPDPELQNLDIMPKDPVRDGIKSLRLESNEKRPIEFAYLYKDAQIESINISAPPPAVTSAEESAEVLTVPSVSGHIVNFTLTWKGGELKGVRAEPAQNPFGEVK